MSKVNKIDASEEINKHFFLKLYEFDKSLLESRDEIKLLIKNKTIETLNSNELFEKSKLYPEYSYEDFFQDEYYYISQEINEPITFQNISLLYTSVKLLDNLNIYEGIISWHIDWHLGSNLINQNGEIIHTIIKDEIYETINLNVLSPNIIQITKESYEFENFSEYFLKIENNQLIKINSINDRNAIIKGIENYSKILKYASDTIKNDKEIVLKATTLYGEELEFASVALQNDKEVVLKAVNSNGDSLKFASEKLRNDREIVLKAVKQDGNSLYYASKEIKNNEEIILEAINENVISFQYASDLIKTNKNLCLIAVEKEGLILEYLSNELKKDIEIVKIAVSKNGNSLEFASEDMKKNNEIVKIAVSNSGYALKYASEELKNNKEIVLKAINSDFTALEFASENLKKDNEIQLMVEKQKNELDNILNILFKNEKN